MSDERPDVAQEIRRLEWSLQVWQSEADRSLGNDGAFALRNVALIEARLKELRGDKQ